MKNKAKILLNYFFDILFKGTANIIFSLLDVLGLYLLFFPRNEEIFQKNPLLVAKIGLGILIVSFICANIITYIRLYEKLYTLNEKSIIIGYSQGNYDYAEIVNVSGESLAEISANLEFFNSHTNSNEIQQVSRFFQKNSNSVWDNGQIINCFENNQRIYIQLPRSDLIQNNNVLVVFHCKSQRSSTVRTYSQTIALETRNNNYVAFAG